jgi:hypothetical protein
LEAIGENATFIGREAATLAPRCVSFGASSAAILRGGSPDALVCRRRLAESGDLEAGTAWAELNSTQLRRFPGPTSGRICAKVINPFGDEVQKGLFGMAFTPYLFDSPD